jgi:hypothetical protein
MINTAQVRMQNLHVPRTAHIAAHVLHVTLRCTQTLKSQWTRSHFSSNSWSSCGQMKSQTNRSCQASRYWLVLQNASLHDKQNRCCLLWNSYCRIIHTETCDERPDASKLRRKYVYRGMQCSKAPSRLSNGPQISTFHSKYQHHI